MNEKEKTNMLLKCSGCWLQIAADLYNVFEVSMTTDNSNRHGNSQCYEEFYLPPLRCNTRKCEKRDLARVGQFCCWDSSEGTVVRLCNCSHI